MCKMQGAPHRTVSKTGVFARFSGLSAVDGKKAHGDSITTLKSLTHAPKEDEKGRFTAAVTFSEELMINLISHDTIGKRLQPSGFKSVRPHQATHHTPFY